MDIDPPVVELIVLSFVLFEPGAYDSSIPSLKYEVVRLSFKPIWMLLPVVVDHVWLINDTNA